MAARNALFIGSKSLGLEIFKTLLNSPAETIWTIVHPDDRDDPRSCLPAWQEFADARKLPIIIAGTNSELAAAIDMFRPDVGLVCGWYRIVESSLLAKFPLGLWGIHNSLLPRYRGGSPLVWSIINGDQLVGSSVFKFEKGIDTGPLLLQVSVENDPSLNVSAILDRIQKLLVAQLPEAWSSLLEGVASWSFQDETLATYSGQRIPSDGEIEWYESAGQIHNFIRAQQHPYPGAFSRLDGKLIFFSETEVIPATYFGTPGQVLQRHRDYVIIACGNNSGLLVKSVNLDGKRFPAAKILSSISCRLGPEHR